MNVLEYSRNAGLSRVFNILWATVFAWALALTLATIYQLAETAHALTFSAILLILYGLLKLPADLPLAPSRLRWTLIAGAFYALWFVTDRLFGQIDLQAILFHFNYEIESNRVVGQVVRDAAVAVFPFVLMTLSWWHLFDRSRGLNLVNRILPAVLVFCNPLIWIFGQQAFAYSTDPVVDLGQHYALPADIPPPRPKNLIHIFVESAERTMWDEDRFGNVAEPLKRLSSQGWTATGIEQIEMTGWTLAGHVAATCGVPLLPVGMIRGNSFDWVEEILPHADCLGDVLDRNGYTNVFLKGASLDFAGTRGFGTAHGYDRLLGFDELHRRFPERYNAWGLHDEDLLSVAYDEITALRSKGAPFSLMMTTLGGHSPAGFVSPACEAEGFVKSQPNETLRGFACTNLLVERFVERLRQEGMLENTIVILQSDHLAMRNEVYGALNAVPRHNMFMVLGSDRVANQSKPAATIDIFPTILEELGFQQPEGRAGLGRSLFASEPTLVEQYGVGPLNHAIGAAQDLRDRLWGLVRVEG
jgi:phosphoglycerol transferase